MELYTLRLNRPLAYRALGARSAAELLSLAASASEGDEFIALWDGAALISDGPDGPRVALPLPAPAACGAVATAAAGDLQEAGGGPRLETDAYLFCQGRAGDEAAASALLEWFARESWWAKERYESPIYLRLVREDGKTAAQVLARKIEG